MVLDAEAARRAEQHRAHEVDEELLQCEVVMGMTLVIVMTLILVVLICLYRYVCKFVYFHCYHIFAFDIVIVSSDLKLMLISCSKSHLNF